MGRDIAEIFTKTPIDKQVMMLSATFSKEVRKLASKFMQEVTNKNHLLLFAITILNSLKKFSSMMKLSSSWKVSCNTT